jgi:hypothetical protein
MGDDHCAQQIISLGVAVQTPSHSVRPLNASSGFLCINKSEIYFQLQKHQLNPE